MGDVPGVWGEIGADSTPLKRGVKDATKELGKFKKSLSKSLRDFGRGVKQIGEKAALAGRTLALGAVAMLTPLALAIKQAGDFQESLSKFKAVFKEFSDDSLKWSEGFATTVGRSRSEIVRFMATMQDTFVPLGFARDKAAELSKSMIKLAVDVASFNNASDEEVIRGFQSALVGNHETVRRYGIIITQATLNQELLNQGIAGGIKNATAQQKVQARLNIIMQGTTDAHGDAERTAGSYANQVKRLEAALSDLAVVVGNVLLPRVTELVKQVGEQIKVFEKWVKDNPEAIKQYAELALWIGKVAVALIALGVVVKIGAWVVGLVKGIGIAVGAVKGLIALLGAKGLLVFLGPAGLIALGIGGVVAAIVTFRREIWSFIDTTIGKLQRLRDKIASYLGLRRQAFGEAVKRIGQVGAGIALGPTGAATFQALTPVVQAAGAAAQGSVTDNRQVVINVQGPIDEASLAARVKNDLRRDSYREQGI